MGRSALAGGAEAIEPTPRLAARAAQGGLAPALETAQPRAQATTIRVGADRAGDGIAGLEQRADLYV